MHNYINLVLSGGAFKAVSFIGCIRKMEEMGWMSHFKCIVGSSAGAIVGLMVAIGLSSQDMERIAQKEIKDYAEREADTDGIFDLFDTFGLIQGDEFEALIASILENAGLPKRATFLDLAKRTGRHFVVCVSNVTDATSEFFSVDSRPDMEIVRAVRTSISIPFLMTPVVIDDKIYVDAGLFNNFPVEYFHDEAKPYMNTVSLLTPMFFQKMPASTLNFLSYLKSIIDAVLYRQNDKSSHPACSSANNLLVTLDPIGNDYIDYMYGIDADDWTRIKMDAPMLEDFIARGYDQMSSKINAQQPRH
jgi:predicted acylesterase/phospholipase RssA